MDAIEADSIEITKQLTKIAECKLQEDIAALKNDNIL